MKRCVCLILALVCLLCSCATETADDFFAMDTYMQIKVYGNGEDVDEAKEIINDIDRRFSVSAVDGELYTLILNGRLENPSEELLAMLRCAKTLYDRTGGAYDVTSLALTRLWQSCEDEGRKPTSDEINGALSLVGMGRISFDENAVNLNGVAGIDLGSIAKGYAGQLAADRLGDMGADGGILNLGGNISVFGKKPSGELFKIGITDPNNPDKTCGYVQIDKGNVVTSGKYNRSFEIDGVAYHHIIDARTGMPVDNEIASVTVICDDGMLADGLSTALLLMGVDGALNYYNTYGGFEAVIVKNDGSVVITSDKTPFYMN